MNELNQTKDDFLENVSLLFWIREIIISIDEKDKPVQMKQCMIYAGISNLV